VRASAKDTRVGRTHKRVMRLKDIGVASYPAMAFIFSFETGWLCAVLYFCPGKLARYYSTVPILFIYSRILETDLLEEQSLAAGS